MSSGIDKSSLMSFIILEMFGLHDTAVLQRSMDGHSPSAQPKTDKDEHDTCGISAARSNEIHTRKCSSKKLQHCAFPKELLARFGHAFIRSTKMVIDDANTYCCTVKVAPACSSRDAERH